MGEKMKEYALKGKGSLKTLMKKFHSIMSIVCYGEEADHTAEGHAYYEVGLAYFDKRLDDIEEQIANLSRKGRVKKEPSAYNLHVAEEVRKGKTFLAATQSWKDEKQEAESK